MVISGPSISKGFAITWSNDLASISACLTTFKLLITTANSSPPKRDSVSALRMRAGMRRATRIRSASPKLCPKLSLTSLNLSRST